VFTGDLDGNLLALDAHNRAELYKLNTGGAIAGGEAAKKNLDEVVAFIKNPKAPMPKLYPAPFSEQDVAEAARLVASLQ